ncbi:MAG: M23 family metallopeptidase [Solirubrobacteraceae bacterium]
MPRPLLVHGCAIAIALGVPATAGADGAGSTPPPAAAADSGGTTAGSGATGPAGASGPGGGGTSYGTGTEAERAAQRRERRAAREQARRARVRRQRAAQRRARIRRQRRSADARDGAVLPIQGSFSYGDGFGAPRPGGRKHRGQDMAADQGTPVVSPRAGKVTTRGYQGDGAGYYLVIADAGSDLSYVFMHLEAGSLRVEEGNSVQRGERIASVGSTGSSTGPHLHFEIWKGGWYSGGEAIDPLPYLKRWER